MIRDTSPNPLSISKGVGEAIKNNFIFSQIVGYLWYIAFCSQKLWYVSPLKKRVSTQNRYSSIRVPQPQIDRYTLYNLY